jgi:HEAT repeat protein
LVIELKDPFLDYNKIIAKQIQRLGRQSLSNFLSKILENNDFSWEGHLYRGKVADLLRNIGEEAIEEVKVSLLSEKNSQRLRQLIEIAGLLKREDLLTLLKNSTDSQDYDVREATVFALGNIAGAAAKQILSEMAKDKDLRISRLAKREIGV